MMNPAGDKSTDTWGGTVGCSTEEIARKAVEMYLDSNNIWHRTQQVWSTSSLNTIFENKQTNLKPPPAWHLVHPSLQQIRQG